MQLNSLFQLTLPDDWEDVTVHTYKGPIDDGVQHNIVLSIDNKIDKNLSLTDYVSKQMAGSKQTLPGFEMIKEGKSKLKSGIPVYIVIYRFRATDEQAIFQKQLFIVHEGKAYMFTSTFSKKTLKTISQDVDKIIASFKPITVTD